MNPIISKLYHDKMIEAVAYDQYDTLSAGLLFSRAEGIVPAPESTHAVKGAIEEALRAKEEGVAKTIVFCLSGHGYFEMYAYDALLKGQLGDSSTDEQAVAIDALPKV